MDSITNLSPAALRQAADVQEQIHSLQKELGQILGGDVPPPAQAPKGRRKRRKLSARAIANIRAGVAKRMAAQGKAVQKPKRKMSAQGLANIRAAQKARWAKVKARKAA